MHLTVTAAVVNRLENEANLNKASSSHSLSLFTECIWKATLIYWRSSGESAALQCVNLSRLTFEERSPLVPFANPLSTFCLVFVNLEALKQRKCTILK